MPTRKVPTPKGKKGPCYRWGSGKVYCGDGAKARADAQGAAVHAAGYRSKQEYCKIFRKEILKDFK